MKRKISLFCLAATSAVIWQCNSPVQSPTVERANSQTMSVAFAIKTNSEFNAVAHSALVTVSAYDMDSLCQQMVISDSLLYASISNIPLGRDRLFTIRAYDSMGNVRYSGSQTVSLDGSPTRVIIVLRKVSGPVEIIGIIQDSSYWHDTTYYDSTWHDSTYSDTTYYDSTYYDSTATDGGDCSYDTVSGQAVFKSVSAFAGDTIYQATFDFRSQAVFLTDRNLYVSKTTARKIALNKPVPAEGLFIVKGTCTPEIFTVRGVVPVW